MIFKKKLNTKWNGPLNNDEYYTTTNNEKTQQDQSLTNNNNNSAAAAASVAAALAIVLLLGNHSSGKSTFCNYLLGRTVQTAGVAPTDDCFTVIAPGPVDVNQDGIALSGNPDFGFTSLRQFGPTLLHHTILKVRANTQTNFLLIDTPGIIDAPGNYNGIIQSNPYQNQSQQAQVQGTTTTTKIMDRG
jgi:septin family protein